jgi:hypothetical protein
MLLDRGGRGTRRSPQQRGAGAAGASRDHGVRVGDGGLGWVTLFGEGVEVAVVTGEVAATWADDPGQLWELSGCKSSDVAPDGDTVGRVEMGRGGLGASRCRGWVAQNRADSGIRASSSAIVGRRDLGLEIGEFVDKTT